MDILKLGEEGYEFALYGLSLSFAEEGTALTGWDEQKMEQMKRLAPKQAHRDGGHNKFLESMITWFHIRAPRGWWQEYDTYRLETKQSASTMHTIQKRGLTPKDYEEGTDHRMIDLFNEILFQETEGFTSGRLSGNQLQHVKWSLPEGYLQTRQVRISYKTLRGMILQRKTHRLEQWQFFLTEALRQVDHQDLLPSMDNLE